MTTDELREAVAAIVSPSLGDRYIDNGAHDLADRILSIPYIAEAITSKQRIDNMRLGPSIGTGTREE